MFHSIYAHPSPAISMGFLLLLNFQFSMAHVYIKFWKSDTENNFQLAQKQPASKTAYRDASENIGWIGSDFLSGDKAIVCGASRTPFDRVSSPGGKYFADSSETVGKTLTVAAGGKITLVTAGDPGKGFPHPDGHIQVYLGYCGPSDTACQSFDATTADYFKIQEVKNAVQDKLRHAMDYSLDGNVWVVPIPATVPQGSYIFRFEIITFNQSNAQEGHQDQYYPSCGQLYVKSSHQGKGLSGVKTVKFPGAYKNGNIRQTSAPGPSVMQLVTRSESNQSKKTGTSIKPTTNASLRLKSADTQASEDTETSSESSGDSSDSGSEEASEICLPKLVPSCAKMCLAKKHEEADTLAAGCGITDGKCLCSKESFVQAYKNCAKDHCASEAELTSAVALIKQQCDRLIQKRGLNVSQSSLRRHWHHRATSRVAKVAAKASPP